MGPALRQSHRLRAEHHCSVIRLALADAAKHAVAAIGPWHAMTLLHTYENLSEWAWFKSGRVRVTQSDWRAGGVSPLFSLPHLHLCQQGLTPPARLLLTAFEPCPNRAWFKSGRMRVTQSDWRAGASAPCSPYRTCTCVNRGLTPPARLLLTAFEPCPK